MVQMKASATESVSSVIHSQLLLHTTSFLSFLPFTYPSSHNSQILTVVTAIRFAYG